MKIAYLCADRGIPVFGEKGASVHVRELTAALERTGNEVTLLSARMGHGDPSLCAGLIELRSATVAASRALDPIEAREGAKLAEDRELAGLAFRALEGARVVPELLYERYALFHRSGVDLARRLNVPHILELNTRLIEEEAEFRGLRSRARASRIEREIFTRADAVVAVSEGVASYVRERGVEPRRVSVLPNGVDAERFAPREDDGALRAELGFGSAPVVGFIGSLKRWHGVDLLVDAWEVVWRSVPNARLAIVGDGSERDALALRIRGLAKASHVTMVGAIDHKRIPGYLAMMDVAVAPYRNSDRFYFSPLKILEYLAIGRPTVAPRLGQIAELIEDGRTGILYAPDDTKQLGDAIVRLLQRPDLRAEMSARAAAFVRRGRTWDDNARTVTALARQLGAALPGRRARA